MSKGIEGRGDRCYGEDFFSFFDCLFKQVCKGYVVEFANGIDGGIGIIWSGRNPI